MSLFKKRGGLLKIEINDNAIDDKIARLIIRSEKIINDLESALKKKDIQQKEADLDELISLFVEVLDDINVLEGDVERIRLKEQQEKNYVKIHDEQYLIDKQQQLNTMNISLKSLIDMLREHPSLKTLQGQLLDEILQRMNTLVDCFKKVRSDDDSLESIYGKVNR